MNDRAKSPRTLLIADHVWDAFSSMATEMGSERDALVNQALYTFARLNGFLFAADLDGLRAIPRSAFTDSGRLRIAPGPTLVSNPPNGLPQSPDEAPTRTELPRATAEVEHAADVAEPAPALVLLSDGEELERV